MKALLERPVDFARSRHMLCGACQHKWVVDLDWLDRWEQALESCPGCAITCEAEEAPRVTVDPDDISLSDEMVPGLTWYHTSTHSDWPNRQFDPSAELTEITRQRMGGQARVAAWAARQRSKALHLGSYEAAIHNVLRRSDDQADAGKPFYLYRVQLKSSVVVRNGWLIDPSNWVGDVVLREVCPPGIDVARYLNHHEDPGGISLAVGCDAIAFTQQIAIPLPTLGHSQWVADSVAQLARESVLPSPPPVEHDVWRQTQSPVAIKAREMAEYVAAGLPVNLRSHFMAAATSSELTSLEEWARYIDGVTDLIENPKRALVELDRQTPNAH